MTKKVGSGEAMGLFMAEVIKRQINGQPAIPVTHDAQKCYLGYVAAAPRPGDSMRVTYFTFDRVPNDPTKAVPHLHQRLSTPVAEAEEMAESIWKVRTYSGTEYVVQVV